MKRKIASLMIVVIVAFTGIWNSEAMSAYSTKSSSIVQQKPEVNLTHNPKIAFIYHSHNRESWLPELREKGKHKVKEAFDETMNVTLLGKRLKAKLEYQGIETALSNRDYASAIPTFEYSFSYKYSLTSIREALAVNNQLAYFFDIHRDSQRREHTTIKINGTTYAQVYFVIGKGNPKWKMNEAFAQAIHEALNTKAPGLSKGVLNKSAKHGHGEYNQSISPTSLLIEVGGIDNTLEESYRTIDLLSVIISEQIVAAKRVNSGLPRRL
jgi:stage II sporulation protein P